MLLYQYTKKMFLLIKYIIPSFFVLTEAERGAPYNNANSPKPSPADNVFLTSPFIMISHSP
jgi:hypothetical protein